MNFEIISKYKPSKEQENATNKLYEGIDKYKMQTLLGITGSGKSFTIANLIQKAQRPTLIIAHNKTLAAQLYEEIKSYFPKNRVEYFISYYDYYQPESYIPTSDTYIEKEATINSQIEKLRLKATSSLLSRNDVIVVASISCIYGLSNPNDFYEMSNKFYEKQKISRSQIITKLIDMQYERNDNNLESGKFRVRGDTIDIIPANEENIIRIELYGEEIDNIFELDKITNLKINNLKDIDIFPAKQFVVPLEKVKKAILDIKEELQNSLDDLGELEKERLKRRVKYDLEMIEERGYCTGIENYSRHFDQRDIGQKPYVLLDYFKENFLLVIDESHQTLPQSRAMYKGDYARKKNLVDFGFRLPSAYDNRPLKFEEFEKYFNNTIFVSATPGEYELEKSKQIVEMIIRPTGLLDPEVEIRPIQNQIKDLISEINKRVDQNERILITTLTKRQAEDLTEYLSREGIKVRYMHSDIDSLDRIEIIRGLRAKEFDVLVGINLLREGLDLPEVSLVAILDADKEGFLRDKRSLIQTIGRAARNANGKVIMYADVLTKSINEAYNITKDRRQRQIKYNLENGIIPMTINKDIQEKTRDIKGTKHIPKNEIEKMIINMDYEMRIAAEKLDFEKAIKLRDAIEELKKDV